MFAAEGPRMVTKCFWAGAGLSSEALQWTRPT